MTHENDPKPSPLLASLMENGGIAAEKHEELTAHVTFLKVVFDLQGEDILKTTILFRVEQSDGLTFTQARSCTVEKKFSPMDVMAAIATGEIPPVWQWPTEEEGFV